MRRAGFVLVGGRSTRMGRDKAWLPFRGMALAAHVASVVAEAAGSVALIGDPEKYGGLGFSVEPDHVRGCGPMGGLYTALSVTVADWNLVVACDMPGITVQTLNHLLDQIPASGSGCVVPVSAEGDPQPLCAAYHRGCLSAIKRAIEDKRFKMKDIIGELQPVLVAGVEPASLVNLNSPSEWSEYNHQK
jgi:molybdopterin-guanine dinucleotide biosynthesis protein A